VYVCMYVSMYVCMCTLFNLKNAPECSSSLFCFRDNYKQCSTPSPLFSSGFFLGPIRCLVDQKTKIALPVQPSNMYPNRIAKIAALHSKMGRLVPIEQENDGTRAPLKRIGIMAKGLTIVRIFRNLSRMNANLELVAVQRQ